MDKIFITDLLVTGIIGVNENERVIPQQMLINITMFTSTRIAGQTDDLNESVSYSSVAKKILAHAEKAARLTLEALAEDLALICLEYPRVQKVIVRVEKPRVVSYATSVGVEIERSRV